jgi:tRNA uridine 5-carboxymethylaminomethyl modification enzyme
LKNLERVKLPPDIDYSRIDGLSTEIRQKLSHRRPATLKEVLSIPGVTPAAINVISIHLTLQAKKQKSSPPGVTPKK